MEITVAINTFWLRLAGSDAPSASLREYKVISWLRRGRWQRFCALVAQDQASEGTARELFQMRHNWALISKKITKKKKRKKRKKGLCFLFVFNCKSVKLLEFVNSCKIN